MTSTSSGAATKGGTLKLAIPTPASALNPLVVDDAGGLCLLAQTGEFLAFDNNMALRLEPMLATSWTPTKGGAVWTFGCSSRALKRTTRGCATPRDASGWARARLAIR